MLGTHHGAVARLGDCDLDAAPPNAAETKHSIAVQHKTSYDESTTMVTSNHARAGTHVYGANHANQRAQTTRYGSVHKGNTVNDDPEGLGGERLMEFQETCTGGACTSYTETQRWIDAVGIKMFSKTGTTLKAITPNRMASEAKHFPYGETDGPLPTDTKDYFATYRRDTTGLDYAWNRYYSPTMGRFTTADPYGGSARLQDPQSWNRYRYAANDPVRYADRNGLWEDDCSIIGCLMAPPEEGGGVITWGVSFVWTGVFSFWSDMGSEYPFLIDVLIGQVRAPQGRSEPTKNSERGIPGIAEALAALTDDCAKALGASNAEVAKHKLETVAIEMASLPLSETVLSDGALDIRYLAATYSSGTMRLNSLLGDVTKFQTSTELNGTKPVVNLASPLEQKLNMKAGSVDNGTFWAIYMLHELGHAFNGLTPDIDKDGNSIENISWKNTEKVVQECFGGLLQ